MQPTSVLFLVKAKHSEGLSLLQVMMAAGTLHETASDQDFEFASKFSPLPVDTTEKSGLGSMNELLTAIGKFIAAMSPGDVTGQPAGGGPTRGGGAPSHCLPGFSGDSMRSVTTALAVLHGLLDPACGQTWKGRLTVTITIVEDMKVWCHDISLLL